MRLIDADALIMSLDKRHEHWKEILSSENKEIEYAHQYAVNVIRNAPIAEPTGDLISREDAITAVAVAALDDKDELEAIKALPSADAVSMEKHVKELNDVASSWKNKLINAEKIADQQIRDAFNSGYSCGMEQTKEALSAEAVQGEWVRKYDDKVNCYWYECDQCGARPPKDQWKNEWHSNFCPNCGAKMIERRET